jgi:excisionase family DNA binding protein
MQEATNSQVGRELAGSEWELILASDVAKRAHMSTQWIYAQTRAGKIPHIRLGRYVRYRSEAIDAWIAANERGLFVPATGGDDRGVPGGSVGRGVR